MTVNPKIKRARQHLIELKAFLQDHPPVKYVLRSDYFEGERCTMAITNDERLKEISVIIGDILHNLRSTLDHRYFEIISPLVVEKEKRKLQFPFCEDGTNFQRELEKRFAAKTGPAFIETLKSLKPFGGKNSNKYLYFIHFANNTDKHRELIPTISFRDVTGNQIKKSVKDFPFTLERGVIGGNWKDFVWPCLKTRFKILIDKDLHVQINFSLPYFGPPGELKMLEQLSLVIDAAEEALIKIQDF